MTVRRWDARRAAASLQRLAWLERASAHVLAGWVPKLPDMAQKLEFGSRLHDGLEGALALRSRVTGLTHAVAEGVPLPAGWLDFMRCVDDAPDHGALLGAFAGVVWLEVVTICEAYRDGADSLADAPSLRLVAAALERARSNLAWANTLLAAMPPSAARSAHLAAVVTAWAKREAGPALDGDWPLWPPRDRVPRAVRPAGLARSMPGSLGLLTVDPVHDAVDVAKFLHADLDEEFTTLELMARNSYEHPEMPIEFHRDMARQAADECRHAGLMLRLLADRGYRYGDFEVSTSSYDGLYAFAPCAPGSTEELLWRMLIRQTFMEGLALDSLAHDIARRAAAGQHDIAEALDYILRDEVFHCRAGVHWCTHLLGPNHRDRLQARYEALKWFTAEADRVRERWVIEHLEQAMAELAVLEEGKRRRGGKPPEHPLNRRGRLQAGLHEEDILQVLSWGYATEAGGAGSDRSQGALTK